MLKYSRRIERSRISRNKIEPIFQPTLSPLGSILLLLLLHSTNLFIRVTKHRFHGLQFAGAAFPRIKSSTAAPLFASWRRSAE